MSVQAMGWVIDHSRQSGGAFVTLLMVANHARSDGTGAWPSLATLARETRMSERGVRYALRQLEDAGELRTDLAAGPNGANLYTVVMGGAILAGGQVTPGGATHSAKGGNLAQQGGNDVPPNQERTVKNHPPAPKNGAGTVEERTMLKNALVVATGRNPDHMTPNAWGQVEDAAKQLSTLNPVPDEEDVLACARDLEWAYGPKAVTPHGIVNNWADWAAGKLRGGRR